MIIFLFSSVLCPYLQSTFWQSYSVHVSFAVAADAAVVAQAVKEPQVITDNMQKKFKKYECLCTYCTLRNKKNRPYAIRM